MTEYCHAKLLLFTEKASRNKEQSWYEGIFQTPKATVDWIFSESSSHFAKIPASSLPALVSVDYRNRRSSLRNSS